MAIYLGDAGYVMITRSAGDDLRGKLNPADVDVAEKRFSFEMPAGALITGDRVNIRRINEDGSLSDQPLGLTASTSPDGSWYVNVDPLDGLRLYDQWPDALAGNKSNAVTLQAPTGTAFVMVTIDSGRKTCVGQVASYTLNTSRDSIDVTALGDKFREYDSGLIGGSGSLSCLWDWRQSLCGEITEQEVPQFFHQLILRQQLGSEFLGTFYIKRRNSDAQTESLPSVAYGTGLFYEARCLVTGVGMDFSSTQLLVSNIDFVLTGEIQIRYDTPDAFYILQENDDKIILEDDTGFIARELEF